MQKSVVGMMLPVQNSGQSSRQQQFQFKTHDKRMSRKSLIANGSSGGLLQLNQASNEKN